VSAAAGSHAGPPTLSKPARKRMSTRSRILFFVTAWLIVLMPFLFWWNTWFGRHLSDRQLGVYLQDTQKPRHIQHALVQIGDGMAQRDPAMKKYYPELVRLAGFPAEEIRNTDAWAMGQDSSVPAFHRALLQMLNDASPTVRGNAALALVRFGDDAGRPQILSLLQSAGVSAASSGKVVDVAKPGTPVRRNGLIAKIDSSGTTVEVRSPITGRVRSMSVHDGDQVSAGTKVAVIDPGTDQVWEALRALYVVGTPEDIPAIEAYERPSPDIPDRVRQQARATIEAIRGRTR
jgi:biotin carboxyl carrier protein